MRFFHLTSSSLAASLLLYLPRLASCQGGEFTLSCLPLTYQRSDPILFPGVVSPHTHVVVGGTNFNRTMSEDLAPNAQNTTCSVNIDRSNYWQPLLYHLNSDGTFEAIPFQGNVCVFLPCAIIAEWSFTVFFLSATGSLLPEQGLQLHCWSDFLPYEWLLSAGAACWVAHGGG